jgi:MYXO-CTERM domain-containing protein
MGPGVYDGSVTITSADAANSPFVVDVSLTVEPGGGDNQAPPAPQLVSPANMADIADANPELTINSVEDPDGHAVTYTFEIYRLGQGVAWDVIAEVPPGAATTYVAIVKTLDFDTAYEWRARAVDSQGLAGPWSDTWMFNVQTPGGDDSSGCGCSASGQGRASLFGLLMLIGLIGIRRRTK